MGWYSLHYVSIQGKGFKLMKAGQTSFHVLCFQDSCFLVSSGLLLLQHSICASATAAGIHIFPCTWANGFAPQKVCMLALVYFWENEIILLKAFVPIHAKADSYFFWGCWALVFLNVSPRCYKIALPSILSHLDYLLSLAFLLCALSVTKCKQSWKRLTHRWKDWWSFILTSYFDLKLYGVI